MLAFETGHRQPGQLGAGAHVVHQNAMFLVQVGQLVDPGVGRDHQEGLLVRSHGKFSQRTAFLESAPHRIGLSDPEDVGFGGSTRGQGDGLGAGQVFDDAFVASLLQAGGQDGHRVVVAAAFAASEQTEGFGGGGGGKSGDGKERDGGQEKHCSSAQVQRFDHRIFPLVGLSC